MKTKRIVELMKQSSLQPYYDSQQSDIEKFAELMVLEFIEIVASSDPTRNIPKKRATTKILSEPYSSIITRIEDHFGVDE